ncbi:MAG: heparinase II/III family protein [Deltaproteobacteria bacterium]|nr:heparinase II/III family protein [Deltaproteobacteria bacterium]MBW2534241.1 heparinase II/III family protein [Deltaproteobacteria bacterium]
MRYHDRVKRSFPAWAIAALLAAGCSDANDEPAPTTAGVHPTLLVTADWKEPILARLDREPYATVLARLEERADRPYEEPDPHVWDHGSIGHNNETAQANAVLAWLLDDEARAATARDILLRMPTDFESNKTWDVNIRMPHVLMPYVCALDLLQATPWITEAEVADARARVTTVNEKFYDQFLENPAIRHLVLGESQNNHPIRTAAAIASVAIAFPDHPLAETWASWSISEIDYLFGPEGRYIQADGGVSEGPHYYAFALSPALALFIMLDNAVPPDRTYARDCRNRRDIDPWNVTDCVDGESFAFDNPLRSDRLRQTLDWHINLRLPSGWRAPLADSPFRALTGGPLLTSFGGAGHLRWDWENTAEESWPMTGGLDLIAHHLVYLDDGVAATEPPWRNRFLADAGNAVFRSGWDQDGLWLLLVAENGPARKTLHDHVDGTSFTLAAYGDYLLVDPGYHKPDELDNAVTAHSNSHNTVRIGGHGAPDKGLLTNFGDADAFLEHAVDGDELAYAEAHQSYENTDIERSIAFVRQRYFVVADRLSTTETAPRSHAWRLGGYAGYDVGHTFDVWDCQTSQLCGVRVAREHGGVEVHLAATDSGLQVVEPPYEPLTAPHVGEFDHPRTIEDHGVIDGVVEAVAPGYLAVLAPYRVGASAGDADGPLTVTPLDGGADAAAWLVETTAGVDLVWLRKSTAPSSLTLPDSTLVESDAELTIVDLAGSFGLIARGTAARIDGQQAVAGDGAAGVVTEEP